MAPLSLVLTFLSVLTLWLVVPMFILPPLAFYCGLRSWRASRLRQRGVIGKVLAVLPMVLAIAALPLDLYLLNTGYRA